MPWTHCLQVGVCVRRQSRWREGQPGGTWPLVGVPLLYYSDCQCIQNRRSLQLCYLVVILPVWVLSASCESHAWENLSSSSGRSIIWQQEICIWCTGAGGCRFVGFDIPSEPFGVCGKIVVNFHSGREDTSLMYPKNPSNHFLYDSESLI